MPLLHDRPFHAWLLCYTLSPELRDGARATPWAAWMHLKPPLMSGSNEIHKGVVALTCSLRAALMQDQARSFQSRGIQAEYLSSSQTSSEQEAILKRLRASRLGLQLLLTTPESFGTDRHVLSSAHVTQYRQMPTPMCKFRYCSC